MAYIKEKPRYHIVSLRISDEERKALEQATRLNQKSISSILREAMLMRLELLD